MTPDIVVDVGNSHVKWGRCAGNRVTEVVSLGHTEDDWSIAATASELGHMSWLVSGVVPDAVRRMADWAHARGDHVQIVLSYRQLPIEVDVEHPDSVGIDRLLGAIAARALYPDRRVLVVDAGTAMTINLVDTAFRGGAIVPGLGLLADALHSKTALLPRVTLDHPEPFPGRDTVPAIRAGLCAVLGGAVERAARTSNPDVIIFTGGNGPLVLQLVDGPWKKRSEPWLNLSGLRLAAEPHAVPAPPG
ncbi:MAG: type III pantothenate kinase [Gemmataceae bacterium]|nr:type III pantothenate kinase [Gemmataceae bacterium]